MISSRIRNNRGAVMILFAVCLVALIGITALVIDIGSLRIGKQRSQNVADAAALGGVRLLTDKVDLGAVAEAQTLAVANSWDITDVDSKSRFTATVLPAGTVRTLGNGNTVTVGLNQAIEVTCRMNINYTFAPVLWAMLGESGVNHGVPGATAIAMWTGAQSTSYPLAPWVVPSNMIFDGANHVGEEFTIKVVNQPASFTDNGNFQCVAYDGDSGGADYRKRIGGTIQTGVPLDNGDVLRPENGNMIGPTDQGLTTRLNRDTLYPTTTYNGTVYPNCAYGVWEQTGISTGDYPITPRIIVVPVAQSPLPANGDIVVTGFAAFFIDEAPGGGNVVGHFITARDDGGELTFGTTKLGGIGSSTITAPRLVY